MKKKGRCHNLIQARDKKLIERFYYWSEIKRKRFDDVLEVLSKEEFFISTQRIQRILYAENAYLHNLIETKHSVNKLKLFSK